MRITILLTSTWLLATALRARSAALRHRMWALGIVGALALPFFATLVPSLRIPPLSAMRSVPIVSRGGEFRFGEALARVGPVGGAGRMGPWDVVLAIWALGLVLMLLKLALGLKRLRVMELRSTPMLAESLMRAAVALSESFGVGRRVRIIESASPTVMPLTWGYFKPRILLPQGANAWPDSRRRIVLSHELAHIGRHDWLLQTAAELLRCLYWFHPLAWIAAAKLRYESERACDDLVLNAGIVASEYASELVELARTLRRPEHRLSTALTIARPSKIEGRIAAMLNPWLNRKPISSRAGMLFVVCALFLVLPLATLQLPAQGGSSELTGTVQDASGALVPNGIVTLTNRNADTIDTAASDRQGNFKFMALAAGDYDLRVEKAGFDPYTTSVSLAAGQARSVNVNLHVATALQRLTLTTTSAAKSPIAATGSNMGGNVGEAKIVSRKNPTYPAAAMAAGIEGDVVLRAIIGKDGSLLSVRVVNTQVDPQLAQAAFDAVNKWRYSPTLLDGNAVDTDTIITVSFRLQSPSEAAKPQLR